MAGLMAGNRFLIRRAIPLLSRRLVSTSKKNNETVTAELTKTAKAEAKTEHKNWVSYGFNYSNKEADRNAMHSLMFVSVTLCIAVIGFYWAYLPDYNLRDWAVREAFLEIRRREKAGLPYIDPNFIDPAKIVLPSDEELGDTEIIV